MGATYGWYFNFGLNTHFYVRGAYENILIVEDSATYRELLCKVLKGKGYKVKGVGSVKSALDEIKRIFMISFVLIIISQTIQVQHYFNMNSQKYTHLYNDNFC